MLVFLYLSHVEDIIQGLRVSFHSHVEDIIQGLDVGLSLPLSC